MKDKCVIWGTGEAGRKGITKEIVELKYEVLAYCDSDKEKVGTTINSLKVLGINDIRKLFQEKMVSCIVVAVLNPMTVKEIVDTIEKQISSEIEVLTLSGSIMSELENQYLLQVHDNMKYEYNVDFFKQSQIWTENLMSEVEFWVKQTRNSDVDYIKNYMENRNFFTYDKDLVHTAKNLKRGSIVMDIGCGLVSMYGNILPDMSEIELLPIDPLSYYYNKIYCKGRNRQKECKFGMFEFMADFYEENYSDLILINNALDHCIDPFKSVVECLFVLKVDGKLRMKHRRAEALYEKYSGLHKWNIDYDNNDNFIIWNENNAVNVTDVLKEVADITVVHAEDGTSRTNQFLNIEITKNKSFDLNQYIDEKNERYYLANIIESLMKYFADVETNRIFYNICEKYK